MCLCLYLMLKTEINFSFPSSDFKKGVQSYKKIADKKTKEHKKR